MDKKLKDLKQGEIFFGAIKGSQGNEQKGKRPYLVVSHEDFNEANDFALVMPLSNQDYDTIGDAIEVETKYNHVTGYVLTQHISPFYESFIKDPSLEVGVVDSATLKTLSDVKKLYDAITSITAYESKRFKQGEIIEATFFGARQKAVVLSENSFNVTHNTIWIAPIVESLNKQSREDNVLVEEFFDEEHSKYSYVLCEHIKNISIRGRSVVSTSSFLKESELESCKYALDTFL